MLDPFELRCEEVLYFAFGSNMSRARLEARVGPVRDLGHARLPEHRHRFNKLGSDGTGKGNVEAARGGTVHGVLYELTPAQLDTLDAIEGGYRRADVDVQLRDGPDKRAITYVARRPSDDLDPTASYVDHYRRGIEEHALPPTYLAELQRRPHPRAGAPG